LVRGTNTGSGDTVPLRIIPERHEVFENDIKATGAEHGTVLDDDPLRPDFPDDPGILFPES
jgi:hypothetical protein